MSNYKKTLQYMFEQLPMYQRKGEIAYKKNLNNISVLCEKMNNPHLGFQSVHIAGTNGKGSVSNMLANVLQQCGLKVGLYTSPHYVDFRERIRINGKKISKKYVVDHVKSFKKTYSNYQPSFFEMTVAMAFSYFNEKKVDIAVIETGLGGRLDSTNILTPILSVITNIGLDHQNMLGNTIELIAREKAGIIKSNIPVILGEYTPEANKVCQEVARKNNSNYFIANKSVVINQQNGFFDLLINGKKWLTIPNLYQIEGYQEKNISTSLMSLFVLQKVLALQNKDLVNAIQNLNTNFKLVGRLQTLSLQPRIIVDSAHNIPGIKALFKFIEKLKYDQLHLVIAMVKDKDVESILSIYPQTALYYISKANIPRGLPKEDLQIIAQNLGFKSSIFSSVSLALKAAKTKAAKNDLILVTGSIFTVGEIL